MSTRLLTIDELTEALGVQKSTVYSWTHRRKIPFVRIGKYVRFPEDQIERWIHEHSVQEIKGVS